MNVKKHATPALGAVFVVLASSLLASALLGERAANPVAAGPVFGTRVVYIDAQYPVDPVTITNVAVGDEEIRPGVSTGPREVRPGTPFQVDEDWLKNMSISLKNRTDKVIVRAEIQLWFPDTGDGSPAQPVTTYTIAVGRRPEIDSHWGGGRKFPPEPHKQPILLAPGQTLVIRVSDYFDGILSRVGEKLPFSQVTRIAIQRSRVYFVDGMSWDDLNGFGVPDQNHPGKFTYMDRNKYFPGDRRQDWPPPTQQVEPGRRE